MFIDSILQKHLIYSAEFLNLLTLESYLILEMKLSLQQLE
jgi:hypothetical protein